MAIKLEASSPKTSNHSQNFAVRPEQAINKIEIWSDIKVSDESKNQKGQKI
jgi:hypothetical protein